MASEEKKVHFRLLTPSGEVFHGEVDQVTVTTKAGEITILPRHIPLVAPLQIGHVMIRNGEKENYFAIDGGVVEVRKGSEVIILSNRSEGAEEIDIQRAEEAAEKARKFIASYDAGTMSNEEYARLQYLLAKEENRLRIAKAGRRK